MDMKRRNSLDAKPLEQLRKNIRSAKSIKDFLRVIAELHRIGLGAPWGTMIDQDIKNSERYVLYLGQDGLGMPERDYYLKDDPESVRVRTAYLKYAERLFVLMGRNPKDAKEAVEKLLLIETKLAKASTKKEDLRDPEKNYHKMNIVSFNKLTPNIDWHDYLVRTEGAGVRELIVMQPKFFSAVSDMLDSISLEDWKTYLEWHLVNDLSGVLSSRFIKASFGFYGTTLTGTKLMRPLWRRVLGAVQGALGEPLGQIYVKKHFPPEAKKKMMELVQDLYVAFEARIKGLDWMTPATKKKALKKLKALNPKIGYPDKWKSYHGLKIDQDDYLGNILRSNLFEHKRLMKRLSKPIDRSEWFMFPQTVNAYFAATLNDIVFPAAILQSPYFSLTSDDAINYGSIGSIIGHEMTHGFDDEGSKFDAKGNLKSWWTPADKKRFVAKTTRVQKQFDKYSVADGVKVNGKLTLGENVADLGGVSIAYDAYMRHLEKTGRKDIDGYTPEQRFFLGLSLFDCGHSRPEVEKMQVLTDPHSPNIFRINGPASNLDIFYDAFGVKKGDKLYREPKDREIVW